MIQKRSIVKGICLFMILLTAGCSKPEVGDSDGAAQDMVSGSISADTADEDGTGAAVSGNGTEDTVSGNESQDTQGETVVFELSNGLHARVPARVSRDLAIEGITEWIGIYGEIEPDSIKARSLDIPNVYGTITDIRMDNFSNINICYKDEEGKDGQVTIPLDFYAAEGNVVEPVHWEEGRLLCYNVEELTNETGYPIEVWSEAFISGGKEYTAVYSRISPMYRSNFIEGFCFAADYQFAIRQDGKTLYEIKLYQMKIDYEEVYYMEDVNGDGIKDFILINNEGYSYQYRECTPYVFIWDQEQETCISGGPIAPKERALYNSVYKFTSPVYKAVDYDRDSRIFYDTWTNMQDTRHDIHDMVIVCGARFIDGEWKTVYELYLGKAGEDYARETKYDDEGNIISEIIYTDNEYRSIVSNIYDECEVSLYRDADYHTEEVVVNGQFSYSKYVRNEE